MNAIKFLLKEHDKVRKILTDIVDGSHRYETKKEVFANLAQNLLRHETMEEKLWYPFLKKNNELAEVIKHLVSEEHSAEKAIQKLTKINDQKEWEAMMFKFKNDVEHHAAEEEEKLFPKVETLLSEDELKKIGKEMYEFKTEFNDVVKPQSI